MEGSAGPKLPREGPRLVGTVPRRPSESLPNLAARLAPWRSTSERLLLIERSLTSRPRG